MDASLCLHVTYVGIKKEGVFRPKSTIFPKQMTGNLRGKEKLLGCFFFVFSSLNNFKAICHVYRLVTMYIQILVAGRRQFTATTIL